jgi:hypothetical protein
MTPGVADERSKSSATVFRAMERGVAKYLYFEADAA